VSGQNNNLINHFYAFPIFLTENLCMLDKIISAIWGIISEIQLSGIQTEHDLEGPYRPDVLNIYVV
jgi:hypothetical protein